MRPLGIDLFAGAGGMSLGFEQAGFDLAAAVEIDPIHCATHKFNFPNCTVVPRSVVGLSADEIRQTARIGDRKIAVVFGGPPCQGFSLIGQRCLDDARNRLVLEFVRLVAELDADSFVFENVKGLTLGPQRAFLAELIEAFAEVGYSVRIPPRVLNAACFNVPQNRERLIVLGAKKHLTLPDYPRPVTAIDPTNRNSSLTPAPTCAEAIGDLPDADKYDYLFEQDEAFVAKWAKPSAYAAELRLLTDNAWHFGYPRLWNPRVLTSSMRTGHTDISRRRFAETKPGEVEPISRFYRLSAAGLSNTLRAGTDAARGAFTSPRPIHHMYPRCITVREMARLHGFPDWFRLHRTKWHGARQVGNAVPPPLARAIARQVMRALGLKETRPKGLHPLGDPDLLGMDMSKAAHHFSVVVPIGRRDRKSGAKKRRQQEIEAEAFGSRTQTETIGG
ncbi:MAG TPA: DNA cytosine methyltransferase [Rhizomicrobium sp.]|jgi:DNA (cytosine-5)-methyltransferase 1|nr:DNA cytosine methyltransferase [Rhizomicrobium sp.]